MGFLSHLLLANPLSLYFLISVLSYELKSSYLIQPNSKVKLSKLSTSDHDGFRDKDAADAVVAKHTEQLTKLQEVFYAAQSKAILIVLQGMDTAGKDGTIRHIFSGINRRLRCFLIQGAHAARSASRLPMALPGQKPRHAA